MVQLKWLTEVVRSASLPDSVRSACHGYIGNRDRGYGSVTGLGTVNVADPTLGRIGKRCPPLRAVFSTTSGSVNV